MTSTTSMIMEQAVMPMDTIKYNHKHQSFYRTYQPPYFWTRYRLSLLLQNIGLHTSGQDMTYTSGVHDKGDLFSKLLEQTLLEKFITTDSKTFYIRLYHRKRMRQRGPQIGASFKDGILFSAPDAKLSLWYHTLVYSA